MSGTGALIVPFLGVDRAVGAFRRNHDPAAALGVPAHITIHYPWLRLPSVDQEDIRQVRELAAATPPHPVAFRELRWFGTEVLWLAPDPAESLVDLSESSARRWPGHLRYGGQMTAPVPHLMVAQVRDGGDRAEVARVEAELGERLPLRDEASEVWWMVQGEDGRWARRAAFGFGR
ncbi:2'-5' RNA ligase family protein [Rugosimonospora acidiphila]|uniref:2'-5' RNA ligase family protein n=1 Tax=Rugosimonospora acidiphila TaxID=556531 RepID=A0ABP9SQT4_9ACTN